MTSDNIYESAVSIYGLLEIERWSLVEIDLGVFTTGENLERSVPLKGNTQTIRSMLVQILVNLLHLGVQSFTNTTQ